MRIYIAGPYCPRDVSLHDAARVAHQNVQRVIAKFHELKAEGHEPFVPHLSHYLHLEGDEDYADWWIEYDLTFLDYWAEAIYMMDGWKKSFGSLREEAYARKLGLEVLYETQPLNLAAVGGAVATVLKLRRKKDEREGI